MNNVSASSTMKRQRGAVLAITLLILLVVTTVGVTTMGSSNLQLFLARNTHLKQISFQNAESTVLNGEITWSGKVNECLADYLGCEYDITPPMISDIETFLKTGGVEVSPYKGKYVVEYLGWRDVPGDEKITIYYRISSRATGPDGKAVTQIQTIYRKCMNEDGSPCPPI